MRMGVKRIDTYERVCVCVSVFTKRHYQRHIFSHTFLHSQACSPLLVTQPALSLIKADNVTSATRILAGEEQAEDDV